MLATLIRLIDFALEQFDQSICLNATLGVVCFVYSITYVDNMPRVSSIVYQKSFNNNNNNNNGFFCANILEDQAQWRDKTKGLRKLVIESNA